MSVSAGVYIWPNRVLFFEQGLLATATAAGRWQSLDKCCALERSALQATEPTVDGRQRQELSSELPAARSAGVWEVDLNL